MNERARPRTDRPGPSGPRRIKAAGSRRHPLRAALWMLALACLCFPSAQAATASKTFKMTANRPLSLDLSAGNVRATRVIFEFPSSVLRLETANKARVEVTNSGTGKVRIGLAIALFDEAGNLVAAGTGGNKGGQIAPGGKEEFSVFFYYVSENIGSAATFQITLEVK